MYCISRQIRGPYKRKKIANHLHRHRMLKVIDTIISFWMISLLGVFWGSYPRICRAKGTNQNFRKFRLSASWQPCSPFRPSLSRFVGTSRTERNPGYEVANLVKPRANGHNVVGCYMLRPFAHPVACCWESLRKVWNYVKTNSAIHNIVGPTVSWFLQSLSKCALKGHGKTRRFEELLGVIVSVCT